MSGWVKIHRQFLNWEWFNKSEAVHLFMYLLLKANHTQGTWQGNTINKGQFITSYGKISSDTGISIQTIRTLLKKFEKTNEINTQTTNKFTLITICKYDTYQSEEMPTNKQLTSNQQSTNKQLTTNKNNKEEKESNIPSIEEFVVYGSSIINDVSIDALKLKYQSWLVNGWCTSKDGKLKKIVNWKSTLSNTVPYLPKELKQPKSNDQLFYENVMKQLGK